MPAPAHTFQKSKTTVKAIGEVVPEKKVNATAKNGGDVVELFYKVSDSVKKGDVLAYLSDNNTQTRLSNAQMNYYNMLSNLEATKRSADEQVRQAEINLTNADEQVRQAEIGLKQAKTSLNQALDSYESTKDIQNSNIASILDSYAISYSGYLTSIDGILDQTTYIIGADDEKPQRSDIRSVLSAKKKQSLTDAKNEYDETKNIYDELSQIEIKSDNVESHLDDLANLANLAKNMIQATIEVLDNTVTNTDFTQDELNTAQDTFAGLKGKAVEIENTAKANINELENLELNQEKEIESLLSQIDSAREQVDLSQSRLQSANISYENSESQLKSAEESRWQQIISAQNSLDNARGQLNLQKNSVGDLVITAPIDGVISAKYVESGQRINPGESVFEISKTDKLKIESSLPPKDIYGVEKGQTVMINDKITGIISSIDPIADRSSKQVGIEIDFEDKESSLIIGTSVDTVIEMPREGETGTFYLPLESVQIKESGSFIFLVAEEGDKKIARRSNVKTGKIEGDEVEIKEGLRNEDKVITEEARNLEDGDLIVVK